MKSAENNLERSFFGEFWVEINWDPSSIIGYRYFSCRDEIDFNIGGETSDSFIHGIIENL